MSKSSNKSVKMPIRGSVEQREEFERELGGVAVCPQCGDVHYKKKWHRPQDVPSGHLGEIERVSRLCLACKMIKDNTYEGEVFVENFPARYKQDILNLIHAFGKRATEIDPQDRVIKIEENEKGIRFTTTENQLAVKLAKKIKDSIGPAELDISHIKEPAEVTRIHVVFK